MKKCLSIALACLLVCAVAACASPGVGATGSMTPPLLPVQHERGPSLELYVDFMLAEEYMSRPQKVLGEEGYDLVLYNAPGEAIMPYDDGTDDMANFLGAYLADYLKEPNRAAVVSKSVYESLEKRDVLGDIVSIANAYVPRFFSKISDGLDGSNTYLPVTPGMRGAPTATGIAVRTDLFERYGKEIRTLEDWHAFMEFAKVEEPGLLPGRTYILNDEWSGAEDPFLTLFMMKEGYYPLVGWYDYDPAIVTDAQGNVFGYEDVPAFWEAIASLKALVDSGFVEVSIGKTQNMLDASFASALVNTNLFASPWKYMDYKDRGLTFNAEAYTLCIPYEGLQQVFTYQADPHYLVIGKECDPKEALRLLDNLNDNLDLYMKIMIGKERPAGAEDDEVYAYYLDDRGNIVPLIKNIYDPVFFFLRSAEMDAQVPMLSKPSNYPEILSVLQPSPESLQEAVFDYMTDNDRLNLFGEMHEEMIRRHERYISLMYMVAQKQEMTPEDLNPEWEDISAFSETFQ